MNSIPAAFRIKYVRESGTWYMEFFINPVWIVPAMVFTEEVEVTDDSMLEVRAVEVVNEILPHVNKLLADKGLCLYIQQSE